MTREEAEVRSKFLGIMEHMGSPDGVFAIGELLPMFIASLLNEAVDPCEALKDLCSDVLKHVDAINALYAMDEWHGDTLQ